MKIIGWIVGSILFLVALLYLLLFTSFGNGVVANIIQSKLDKQIKGKVELKTFKLSTDNIEILINLEKNSHIKLIGNFNILSKSVNARYFIDIKELSNFEQLIGQQLNGPVFIEGSAKGDESEMVISGNSTIFGSRTEFDINLIEFNPKNVNLMVENANLDKLLHFINQPRYANAKIDIFSSMDIRDLNKMKGKTKLLIKDGALNAALLNSEHNLTIPTGFAFQGISLTNLSGSNIQNSTKFISDAATITVDNVKFNTSTQLLKSEYKLSIANLRHLEFATKTPLNGAVIVDGVVTGKPDSLDIRGSTSLLNGGGRYSLQVIKNEPKNITFHMKDLSLSEALYMVNQPRYADAKININGKVDSVKVGNLKGEISTILTDGRTSQPLIFRDFNISMPSNFSFSTKIANSLKGDLITTKSDIKSSAANIYTKNTIFNLLDTSLKSDYRIDIANLDKLYFITKKHMKGALIVDGDIVKDETLKVVGKSAVAKGNLDFSLVDDNFNANIKQIELLKVTDMLLYPKMLTATADATINYNIRTQKGELHSKMSNGHLLPTNYTTLLKTLANIDLVKELFSKITLDTVINKDETISQYDMKSNSSHIFAKDAKFNTASQALNANIGLERGKRSIYAKVTGTATNPKVKLDVSGALKGSGEGKIEKELEKHVPKKYQEDAKRLLKSFF